MAATMGFPAARIFWKVAWPLRHTASVVVLSFGGCWRVD